MLSEETLTAAQREIAYRQYIVALQAVLSDFQYIEEALRMYLRDAYELIRERTRNDLPFKLSEDDVQKDALGKLITRFEQVCSNEGLVRRLRALVPRRMSVHIKASWSKLNQKEAWPNSMGAPVRLKN